MTVQHSSSSASGSGASSSATGSGANPQESATPGTQFQAVDAGGETRSGSTLMVEAYVVLWVILMGWILLLWRKQAALNARIDELDRVLDKAAAKQGSKS